MAYKTAILGASGYTGAELARLILGHPDLHIAALTGDRKAGQAMETVFPFLAGRGLPSLTRIQDVVFDDIDLVFCALPHATSQSVIKDLPPHVKVVDLSADFRLRDPADYEKWYGKPHDALDLQAQAVYGLTEFYRDDIAKTRLVAGTGCNAAAGQYGVVPLIKAGLIDLDDIIMTLVVGVSGAGRSLKQNLLHAELSEGSVPYGVGGTHRHLGEFDQEFSKWAGRDVKIQFTPHLAPMNRGILATIHVKGDADAIYDAMTATYAQEPFVHVLPFGAVPSTHDVRGSNFAHIGVAGNRLKGRAQVFVALDNLCKGSSGQAVQNANVMLGLKETSGLLGAPLFP
jgi:N-acetyl-gamma-glutamyl-phosphate reductase